MSSFIVLVVVVFAIPSSTRTTLGPTPTSKPLALTNSSSAFGVHEEHRVAIRWPPACSPKEAPVVL